MKAAARRKVSYVVKSKNDQQAHCLGVNSLAIDTFNCNRAAAAAATGEYADGGVLYSAGRDGIVASWDLHLNFKKEPTIQENEHNGIHNDSNSNRSDWKLELQAQPNKKTTSCKAFSQMHTDWVNDIVLCEGGTCVVSASSDRTIKLWKPYSDTPNAAHTIGYHTDYAKCLTYASKPGWVASGGLDRRINIWDIEKQESIISIDASPMNHYTDGSSNNSSTLHNTASKCSIYALAVNPSGNILASGSPEKVVRLWDPKSGKRISKLTGHTDNIRALLISDDGQYILSGSSDSTIKLWSVKAQRCLTTYETHPDSVWSLYSDHPDLKTFYSGSRDGLVNKTEISGQALSDADSECIGLFKEDSGVVKIVALEDTYVWTATSSSSINKWLSVPPINSRQVLPRSDFNPDIPSSALIKLPPAKGSYASQVPDSFIASDSITMYAGSVLSIPVSYQDDDVNNEESLTPLRSSPDYIIQGKPGIISHLMLHNRRHLLTKDTNGEVSMWDLIKCKQTKNFGKRDIEDVAQEVNSQESFPAWCTIDTKIGAITVQLHESNSFDCEMYTDEVELPKGYQVREDQRLNIGKWVLSHLFRNFVTTELKLETEGCIRFSDEQRPDRPDSVKSRNNNNVASTVQQTPQEVASNNETQQAQQTASTAIPATPAIIIPPNNYVNPSDGPKLPSIAVTANNEQSPYLPNSPQVPSFNNGPFTAPLSSTSQPDYFSGTHHAPVRRDSSVQLPVAAVLPTLPTSPTSPTGNNFMNRLKSLSVKAKLSRIPTNEEKLPTMSEEETSTPLYTTPSLGNISATAAATAQQSETATSQQAAVTEESNVKGETEAAAEASYSPPDLGDFPPLEIPSSTMILIAEESAEASTGIDLYRGSVGSVGDDADTIVDVAPVWLLSYLLYNKTLNKETVKLTFMLKPAVDSLLEELPGGPNNRLLANRVLRVRKLGQYIAEKLSIPDKEVELLCQDTVLAPTMTLAAIKQHVLKSSGDIPIYYRRKANAVDIETDVTVTSPPS